MEKVSKVTASKDEKPSLDIPIKKRIFFGLLKNDLEYITLDELQFKIHDQSHFSILYFVLLTVSVLVCTLGLLTNSTAVVIGGMLIAPLTWPLARVGFGVARRNPHHVYRGLLLVVASILIGTLSAYLITTISPIKFLNEEILARTSPTLMDLFIALAAGLVAATAITQRKIADSLAGVAIAVSLMPPLCTVGITLGLRQFTFAGGALLLFMVNAACITLITALVISFNTYLRTKRFKISLRATVFNLLFVLVLAVPLALYLQNYTVEIRSYNQVTTEMNTFAEQKDTFATFENIKVEPLDDISIAVSADLLIPNDSAFTYQDNERLVENLERVVQKKVLLNLRIQTIIEPVSKNQQDNELTIKSLSVELENVLIELNDEFKVSSINVSQNEDNNAWIISAEVFSDPESVPTSVTIEELQKTIVEKTKKNVSINLTFIPRLTLRTSEQTASQEARKTVENITATISANSQISLFTINSTDSTTVISYTIITTNTELFDQAYLESIRSTLDSVLGTSSSVKIRIVQAVDLAI